MNIRYADYSAKKATFEYFKGILLSDESVEAEDLEIIKNPERWDEFDSGYREYLRVIETKIQKVEEAYKLAANYPDDTRTTTWPSAPRMRTASSSAP